VCLFFGTRGLLIPITRTFPPWSAPNYPKIGLVGIPKQEALNARLIKKQDLLRDLLRVSCSIIITDSKNRIFYLQWAIRGWSLCVALRYFTQSQDQIFFSVLGNNLDTFINAWEHPRP
jgi:hypothetical protein